MRQKNKKNILFTPGPASLTYENIVSLGPAFGRGDTTYTKSELEVLSWLKDVSGQPEIVRLQGSATLAIEVALENFVTGKVLLIQTGFYSSRILEMLESRADIQVSTISPQEIIKGGQLFDWVIACPTETSTGYLMPIICLKDIATRVQAKLFLDATASIGLEEGHELANVVCFSSCKGLFGLTGAAFIAYDTQPVRVPGPFSLRFDTYLNKKTTGPYHAIQSLMLIAKSHDQMRKAVFINKEKMVKNNASVLFHSLVNQPKLCTAIASQVKTKNPLVTLYQSRLPDTFRVICHLGEVHLGNNARGKILDELDFY